MDLSVFAPDELDQRLAATAVGRCRCQLCRLYFDIADTVSGHSGICPSCIGAEGDLFQDNLPIDEDGYRQPRDAPEVIVARIARARAEAAEERTFHALMLLYGAVCTIAANKNRVLKRLPGNYAVVAETALDMLESNFPDIAARMSLIKAVESR